MAIYIILIRYDSKCHFEKKIKIFLFLKIYNEDKRKFTENKFADIKAIIL